MSFFLSQKQESQTALLRQIVAKNQTLNTVHPNILEELSHPLKIQQGVLFDYVQNLGKLKNKIVEICKLEREECLNYLSLKKFSHLSQQSSSFLGHIFEVVWEEFKKKENDFQQLEKIQGLLCRSNSINDQANFHLKNFNSIKSLINNEQSLLPQYHQYQSPYFHSFIPQNMFFIPQNPVSNVINKPYEYNQKILPQLINCKSELPKIEELDQNNYSSSSRKPRRYKKRKGFQAEKRLNKRKQVFHERSVQNLENRRFLNCVCKGKLSQSQFYFFCDFCPRSFHYSCLKISSDSAKNKSQKKCPFCYIQQMNMFYEVIGQPLDFFWSSDQEMPTKRIKIKAKKCEQIIGKKFQVHIRFLRVQGLCIIQEGSKTQSIKDSQNSAAIITEIVLKKGVIQKYNGEDIRINFQNFKGRGNQDHKKQNLVVAYVVNQLQIQQIQQKLIYENTNQFLDSFLENKTEVEIQILDSYGNLIQKPCRGVHCTHSQVFDLKEFLEEHQNPDFDNNCLVCSKKCLGLKIDLLVDRQLSKIRQQNLEFFPKNIYYQKNSSFRWGNQGQRKRWEREKTLEEKMKRKKEEQQQDENYSLMDEQVSS